MLCEFEIVNAAMIKQMRKELANKKIPSQE
jgi:hypothetical protein